MFIRGGIVVSYSLNLAVSLVTGFRYSAPTNLLIWLLINDIPVCSCKVTIGDILGKFAIITRT
jgi:hypothetical protein